MQDVLESELADIGFDAGASQRPRTPEAPNDRPLIAGLVLTWALALECGASFVAWRFRYSPSLGTPAFTIAGEHRLWLIVAGMLSGGAAIACLVGARRPGIAAFLGGTGLVPAIASGGRIYSPIQLLVWHRQAAPGKTADVIHEAWFVVAFVALAGSLLLVAAWRRRTRSSPDGSHGSAHWGSPDLLARERGLLIGRIGDRLLRVDGEGHLLTVAPTRSGKGVSCVIPNLLDHPGSAVITDPKGENYAVTSRWRRIAGQEVHALDPFDLVGQLAAYNPLDLVDAEGPDATDDARLLADMLVLPEGKEGGDQPFWNEEARGLLTGLILHVASSPRPEARTLCEVRDLLTLPPDSFRELLTAMAASTAADGLVARAAARLQQKADRERSGVVSTAQSHTHFLDSPRMKRVLGRSTFDFGALKRQAMSVYLVLPSDRLESYARWLRLMIASGLLAVTRTRGSAPERVLFLLDEFAHLRRMQPVQRDISLAGGFGVRFWLVLQDLSQLRSTYGDAWPTFLANADVLQAFGTNDWETAEYLSKMTGEATIQVASEIRSAGVSRGHHSQRQQGTALSTSSTRRRLLNPDEVRRLPADRQLLFIKGTPPVLAQRINSLIEHPFVERADANPLYASLSN
jgi:type IV secretion system protein VirD4